MLKRPKFLKLLIIIYLIYTVIHILDYAFLFHSTLANDLSVEGLEKMVVAYVMSTVTAMYIALTAYLFYNLLALNPGGWLVQVAFSFIYAIAALLSLDGKTGTLETIFLGNNPPFVNIIWGLINVYIIYYFMQPEMKNLFFNVDLKYLLRKQELTNLLNFTDKFIVDIKDGNVNDHIGKKKNILSTTPVKKIHYTPYARILIKENKSIKDSAQIDELNIQIKYKAKRILEFLESMLPNLKEGGILDDISYEYNKKYCWNATDIINEFKERAARECSDKSDFSDKLLKYSKKIDELELLFKTNDLMTAWLENCGSDVSNIIKFAGL